MVSLGFLNHNSPTQEAAQALPVDLESPTADKIEKNIVLFHDQSTSQACDFEQTQWGTKMTMF